MITTLTFAAIDLGMKEYLAIVAGGVVVAVLGLVLRGRLGGRGTIPGWLAAGVSGFLLGLGIAFVLLFQLGYRWTEQPPVVQTMGNVVMGGVRTGQGGAPGGAAPGGGGPGGGAGMGGGGGGMGGGGAGMGGGGGGGGRPPVTPAAVVALVKKLDLLNSGLKIEISDEQASTLKKALDGLEDSETMTNEDAEKLVDTCMSVLSEEQKAVLASFDLPRRRGQQGGNGGPGGGGPGGASPGAAPGDARAGRPDAALPPPNPFKSEDEGKSLASLRAGLNQPGK